MAGKQCVVVGSAFGSPSHLYPNVETNVLTELVEPVLSDSFTVSFLNCNPTRDRPFTEAMVGSDADLVIFLWPTLFDEAGPTVRLPLLSAPLILLAQVRSHPPVYSTAVTATISYRVDRLEDSKAELKFWVQRLFLPSHIGPAILIPSGNAAIAFGQRERSERDEILRRLEQLEHAMLGRIGHNRPPVSNDLTEENISNGAHEAAAIIRQELTKPAPNVQDVAKAGHFLERASKWISDSLDASAKSYGTAIGTAAAAGTVAVAATYLPALRNMLVALVHHIAIWLHAVVPGL